MFLLSTEVNDKNMTLERRTAGLQPFLAVRPLPAYLLWETSMIRGFWGYRTKYKAWLGHLRSFPQGVLRTVLVWPFGVSVKQGKLAFFPWCLVFVWFFVYGMQWKTLFFRCNSNTG